MAYEYKVEVRFMGENYEDAENFVHSMSGSDWMEHLETTSGLDVEETREEEEWKIIGYKITRTILMSFIN